MSTQTDVIIIGAAGLSAAKELTKLGMWVASCYVNSKFHRALPDRWDRGSYSYF